MELNDFTAIRPQKGDIYKFKLSGTTDKRLERLGFSLNCEPGDWSDFQWLGSSEKYDISGTFEQTFEISIVDDPKSDYLIHIVLNNDVAIPDGLNTGDVIATISNAKIGLVGINIPPDDNVTYTFTAPVTYDTNITNMTDAKAQTDFSFVKDGDSYVLLSKKIYKAASAKISGGNVTIILSTPKPGNLWSTWSPDGLTISPTVVNQFEIPECYTSDGKYIIRATIVNKSCRRHR